VSKLSERELIDQCIKGDGKAQKALYEQYVRVMYGVCLRYCDAHEEAKDILQDGFVKVFTKMNQFGFQGSFEGWMKRIFVNTALEYYRSQKNHMYHQDVGEAHELSQVEETLSRIGQKEILNILQGLAPGYRNVLNLYIIEGYSHAEIAEMLGISEGTSKSQLSRARVILQKAIQQQNKESNTP
jgi:RNA polymerase sigma factor (sigma-70 family)